MTNGGHVSFGFGSRGMGGRARYARRMIAAREDTRAPVRSLVTRSRPVEGGGDYGGLGDAALPPYEFRERVR